MKFGGLHIVSAVIEAGAGLALLVMPALVVGWLFGAQNESPAFLTLARIAGGGLLSLGVACWFSRSSMDASSRGVIAAMVVYNLVATGVFAYAGLGLRLHGPVLWPAAIVHAIMSVWCIVALAARNPDR